MSKVGVVAMIEETKMVTGREDAVFELARKLEKVIKEVDEAVGGLTYIEVVLAYAVVDVRLIEHVLGKYKTNEKAKKDS